MQLARRRRLRAVNHAEVAEVAVADGEEDHEHDEVGVAVEHDRQVALRGSGVTVHEQRDEDDPVT